jgi:hypothetical protein
VLEWFSKHESLIFHVYFCAFLIRCGMAFQAWRAKKELHANNLAWADYCMRSIDGRPTGPRPDGKR